MAIPVLPLAALTMLASGVFGQLTTTAPGDPVEALAAALAGGADPEGRPTPAPFWNTPLDRPQSLRARTLLFAAFATRLRATLESEWNARTIEAAGMRMRFLRRVYGEKPATGRSLFISMHGGGQASKATNDGQWRNQIGLYRPAEGVYVAPRAPTDTWNLWHQAHIDPLFDRLILAAILVEEVDPNRVYLMGYSAGGDGVYQLAPRMADRFAAAAMMAGHPNDASPKGLRNLPFAIHCGAEDRAFRRNEVAAEWGRALGELRRVDPDGYEHLVSIHAGRGHWMELEDAVAVPWMAAHTRSPFPKRVVWEQDDVLHSRFSWLSIPEDARRRGALVDARVEGQTIHLGGDYDGPITVILDDALVDLDRPLRVLRQGPGDAVAFEGTVPRTIAAIAASLRERPDPATAGSARLALPARIGR